MEFSRDKSEKKPFFHINCKTMHMSNNLFGLKEDSSSTKFPESTENQLSLSHIKQECQESLIQGKIHNKIWTTAANICKYLQIFLESCVAHSYLV